MATTGLTRRSLLQSILFGAGSLACCLRKKPELVCPTSPAVSFLKGPLTIDTHCHVFNGTDLQVQKFISMVVVRQGGPLSGAAKALGSVLQHLAWATAPKGTRELEELAKIAAQMSTCSDGRITDRVGVLRQEAYSQGRAQLQSAVQQSAEFRELRNRPQRELRGLDQESRARADALRVIDSLPEDAEAYRAGRRLPDDSEMLFSGDAVKGFIAFLLQNFQYRYVSVHDYLRSYNQPGTRVVDLLLPNMVDYDFWLAKGDATATSLPTQVEVMRQISILTGGRVHSFVPFDPLREVAFGLGHTSTGSLALVKSAIENEGFLGVKLYPPMGFAALGNADVQGANGSNFWDREWLAPWTRQTTDLGKRFDAAMSELFRWCEAERVPVMAHTNQSNGVAPEFEALAGADGWKKALAAFPQLRVNFGHFGGASSVEKGLDRARLFATLMTTSDVSPGGRFAHADAGFFTEVIKTRPGLVETLRKLYTETKDKGDAALANRFMYGTDWEMTLTQGSVDKYLEDFIELFEELEPRADFRAAGLTNLAERFLGWNAVNWLGLRKGDKARGRLDTFYARHRVPEPDWLKKVDGTNR